MPLFIVAGPQFAPIALIEITGGGSARLKGVNFPVAYQSDAYDVAFSPYLPYHGDAPGGPPQALRKAIFYGTHLPYDSDYYISLLPATPTSYLSAYNSCCPSDSPKLFTVIIIQMCY